ncbi:MAG: hypothetical protein U0871_10220 [Gemmataceae bacterium]
MLGTVARSVVDFLRAEDGLTAVEYAVMLALIIVVRRRRRDRRQRDERPVR